MISTFELSTYPVVKDLVLLGGGHAHVAVLRRFGMKPAPGVRLTLVSRAVETPYSGMLPGLIAGHYARDDAHIDLQPLSRFAGAMAVFDEVVGLDVATRQVHFKERPPISYDLLSIDIGSTPNLKVPGAQQHAVPVKPIDRLLERWSALIARLRADNSLNRIGVVGGGAGGVELILAVQHAVRTQLAHDGRRLADLEYHLFTEGEHVLPTHNASVRRRFERVLADRQVTVHRGSAVVEVAAGSLRTADGRTHAIDEVLWTTEAAAAPWLAASGLALDDQGFIRVSSTLQSISHPDVFAAGDIASMDRHPRPKSGVFAVRQGPPLARNLRRALLGEPLEPYRPQRRFLSLITTGDRYAVASRGRMACEGAWVWRLKDWIDRGFMRTYQQLPEMPLAVEPDGSAPGGEEAHAAVTPTSMRCGGCGAKVGASVLARALGRIGAQDAANVLVGLQTPDDAAVIAGSSGEAAVHTVDFFRSMIDDPYLFGRVAANHALSDIYAMGAEPTSALAIVTLPPGPERRIEEALTHLMAGASAVFREACVSLVGGHTGEGAEFALGFSVNGRVDPDRMLRKSGLRAGDRLILTKPVGTGTLLAADLRHRARGRWIAGALEAMLQSNREAVRCVQRHGATACTDVTGFGVAGHLSEMLRASGRGATIFLPALPILDGAGETIASGILSSLQPENLRMRRSISASQDVLSDPRFALLFDPQTSGGLLAGVPEASATGCVSELRALGYVSSAIVGIVTAGEGEPGRVDVLA